MTGDADTVMPAAPTSSLADALPDGIVVVDSAGVIVTLNRRMREMTGYTDGELIGQSIDTLVPEPLRVAHSRHRARFTAHPTLRPMGTDLDIVCRRKDGSVFAADIALSPMSAGGAVQIVAAVRDATARRAAERALGRLHLLEQQERLGRDLHDGVIQSVFAVGMSLQGLLSRVDDPDVAERLSQAVRALDDTITELRGFIFGLGKPLSAGAIRAELERLMAECRDRTGIDITGVIDDAAVIAARDHAQDLLLVAREALSNVERHSRARSCRLTLRRSDGVVELAVRDDGRGFDVAAPGGGMGLASARSRAREIGAEYSIVSSPSGTEVRLRLAARPAS